MKTTRIVALLSLTFCFAPTARAETLEWARQVGSSGSDHGFGVWADGLGNVYVAGGTEGSLAGPNASRADMFVVKFSDTVPELATLVMLVLGVLSMFVYQRRQRTA